MNANGKNKDSIMDNIEQTVKDVRFLIATDCNDETVGARILALFNVRISFVDWVEQNYPTLKNHGDSLTLSELRTAYNQYINEA